MSSTTSTSSTNLRPDAMPTSLEAPPRPTTMLSSIMSTPYLPWTTSAVLLSGIPSCVRSSVGFLQLVQLPLFALIFGGSGYMIKAGDPHNGSGTTTAWSLTYLFFHGRKALTSRRPAPILLASTVAVQAAVAGSFYFGEDEDEERVGPEKVL